MTNDILPDIEIKKNLEMYEIINEDKILKYLKDSEVEKSPNFDSFHLRIPKDVKLHQRLEFAFSDKHSQRFTLLYRQFFPSYCLPRLPSDMPNFK